MRPDHHAIRIALELRDVLLQPIDRHREVAASVIPVRARVPLHGYGDHPVLRCPPADVVVEGVAFPNLLLDLVATSTGHKDKDRTISAAFIADEDVEQILWMRSKGLIACDGDSGIQLTFEARRRCTGRPVG